MEGTDTAIGGISEKPVVKVSILELLQIQASLIKDIEEKIKTPIPETSGKPDVQMPDTKLEVTVEAVKDANSRLRKISAQLDLL